jgi:hypothetical protein
MLKSIMKLLLLRTDTDFACMEKKKWLHSDSDSISFLNYNILKSSNKLSIYHMLPVQNKP